VSCCGSPVLDDIITNHFNDPDREQLVWCMSVSVFGLN